MQLSPNQLTLLHVINIGNGNIQSCSIILKKQNFFYKYQFGFRKNHLTGHAASLLIENIAEAFENKEHVLGIFLDLSKAAVPKLCAAAPWRRESMRKLLCLLLFSQ